MLDLYLVVTYVQINVEKSFIAYAIFKYFLGI